MAATTLLLEGLTELYRSAAASLPVKGLGLLQQDGAEHVVMTYVDAFGVLGYRYRAGDVLPALLPRAGGQRRLTNADLGTTARGPVESILFLTGMPDEIRRDYSAQQAVILPVQTLDVPGVLVVGLATADPPSAAQESAIDGLGVQAAELLQRTESPEGEIERLRRLEAVDVLLTSVFHVLDVRWVFDRVSTLTSHILPHDVLGLYSQDLTELTVYANVTGDVQLPDIASTRYPVQVVTPWTHHVIDDLRAHPFERELPLTQAGGRSSIRVPLRLDERMLGALNFTSREPVHFTTADLLVARRIGDYVALALSHYTLAEEARRTEQLRARAATSDLLDELLASMMDAGELRLVFDQVSAMAKKVVRHDALSLAIIQPDGHHARVYAKSGAAFPELVELPPGVDTRRADEYTLIDDIQADPTQQGLPSRDLGYRSALRVRIMMEGRVAGALSFLSLQPSSYTEQDVPVARRIADRLALALSRERRVEAVQRADEATERAARLEARVQALTDELNSRAGYRRVIGESPTWRQALTQATQVAPTESTVLLLGESGTGKEVVARFVHGGSPRTKGPFIALNCAALPDNLLEAELFGYERGAFTGATQSKPGQLEMAAGGTLFLDEVGEMSLPAQAKFLRVLQEREFQRLGGTRVLKTDARVVAATNRDLGKAIERGQFREDLYYRLNVFSIQLPPLRDRKDDVLPLSEAFIEELGKTLGRPPAGISKEARQALLDYHWPGNVRELRNVLERAAILADGGLIAAEHFALRTITGTPMARPAVAAEAPSPPPPAGEDLKATERAMIEKVLQDTQFNKSLAAKRLGISRAQLYVRLKRHGLE